MSSARAWGLWVVALVAVGGCKPPDSINTPDAAATEGGGAEAGSRREVPLASGTVLRYDARARALRQTAHLEMVQRGAGQYAEAALDLEATIDVSPQTDRLKVVWTVSDLGALELRGVLQPQPGQHPEKLLLDFGSGSYLIDLRGQAETDPGLRENIERQGKIAALLDEPESTTEDGLPSDEVMVVLQLLSYLPPLVQLPSLPEQPLPLGEAVKVEREEETELGDTGLLLPFDVEMTYTLVAIDTSGGTRIAEMSFAGSAIGSTDGPGGEVVIESKQSGTLLFNLDDQVPISYESSRTETYEMGQFTGETETTIRASWELADGA